jgi:hypothetical protein
VNGGTGERVNRRTVSKTAIIESIQRLDLKKRAFRIAGDDPRRSPAQRGRHAAGAFYLPESRPLTVGSAYPFPLAAHRNLTHQCG